MSKGPQKAAQDEANPRAVAGNNRPPPAPPPARTELDIATDTGSAVLAGGLLALEAEFDGDMRAVGMSVDKMLDRFLSALRAEFGAEVAEKFARRLRATLNRYVKELRDEG